MKRQCRLRLWSQGDGARFLPICNQGWIVGFCERVLSIGPRQESRDAMNATKQIKDSARDEREYWRAMARLLCPSRLSPDQRRDDNWIPDGLGSEWRLAHLGGRNRFLCGECLSLVRRVTRRSVGESSRISHRSAYPWYSSQLLTSL